MTAEERWKELIEIGKELREKSRIRKRPGELSVTEFAEEMHVSRKTARAILDELVKADLVSFRTDGIYKFYSPKIPKT